MGILHSQNIVKTININNNAKSVNIKKVILDTITLKTKNNDGAGDYFLGISLENIFCHAIDTGRSK